MRTKTDSHKFGGKTTSYLLYNTRHLTSWYMAADASAPLASHIKSHDRTMTSIAGRRDENGENAFTGRSIDQTNDRIDGKRWCQPGAWSPASQLPPSPPTSNIARERTAPGHKGLRYRPICAAASGPESYLCHMPYRSRKIDACLPKFAHVLCPVHNDLEATSIEQLS